VSTVLLVVSLVMGKLVRCKVYLKFGVIAQLAVSRQGTE